MKYISMYFTTTCTCIMNYTCNVTLNYSTVQCQDIYGNTCKNHHKPSIISVTLMLLRNPSSFSALPSCAVEQVLTVETINARYSFPWIPSIRCTSTWENKCTVTRMTSTCTCMDRQPLTFSKYQHKNCRLHSCSQCVITLSINTVNLDIYMDLHMYSTTCTCI